MTLRNFNYSISTEFDQYYWEVVKYDIVMNFVAFHVGTLDVKRLNYGITTLLPKVFGADKITHNRPISVTLGGE
jgi:hypothetical protein